MKIPETEKNLRFFSAFRWPPNQPLDGPHERHGRASRAPQIPRKGGPLKPEPRPPCHPSCWGGGGPPGRHCECGAQLGSFGRPRSAEACPAAAPRAARRLRQRTWRAPTWWWTSPPTTRRSSPASRWRPCRCASPGLSRIRSFPPFLSPWQRCRRRSNAEARPLARPRRTRPYPSSPLPLPPPPLPETPSTLSWAAPRTGPPAPSDRHGRLRWGPTGPWRSGKAAGSGRRRPCLMT